MKGCKKIKIGLGRFLYGTLGNLFFFCSPFPGWRIGRKIRRWCVKRILDKCGEKVNIEDHAMFSSKMSLGDRSSIGKRCHIQGRVVIGDDVMMGPDVKIFTTNHQYDDIAIPMNQQGNQMEKIVTIDDDVWIGANVIILPGVHVKKGAILGAGSVIRRNVEEYAIVMGNPAEVVKYRNQ